MEDEALEEKKGWNMKGIMCHIKPDPMMGTTQVF